MGQETTESPQCPKFKAQEKREINDRHLHNNVAGLFESRGGKVTHTSLIQPPTQTENPVLSSSEQSQNPKLSLLQRNQQLK